MKQLGFNLIESVIALVLFSSVTMGFYAIALDIRIAAMGNYYQIVAKAQSNYLKQAHLAGVAYQQQKPCWQWQGQRCEVT